MRKIKKIDLYGSEQAVKDNDGYCPCKFLKIPDNKCICKQFRDFIKNGGIGECECGLYEVVEEK